MAKIPNKCLERLRAAGLFVTAPFSSSHVLPDSVMVGKPIAKPGNSIPGYETAYVISDTEEVQFNAPLVRLLSLDGKEWVVEACDYAGGRGPGDFADIWNTPEEAVDDIIDFYFGNPKRMAEKAEGRKRKFKPEDVAGLQETYIKRQPKL